MTYACHAEHLVALDSITYGKVPVCDYRLRLETLTDLIDRDEFQEAFSVFFRYIFLCVFTECFFKRELLSVRIDIHLRRNRSVAYPFILIKVNVVYASVVGCHRCDHLILLHPLLFLCQQLFLKLETLFHLFLLDSALCLDSLFLKHDPGVLPRLLYHEDKHRKHYEGYEQCKNEALTCEPVGYPRDLLTDHALTNEICEHPVSTFDRNIVERFSDAIICERYDVGSSSSEILLDLLKRISFLKFCIFQCRKKVVLGREAAEHHVGKRFAVSGVYIAESRFIRV